MTRPDPRVLAEGPFLLAENPLWDGERQRLLWTDINAGHVFAMDWASHRVDRLYSGPKVGGFTLQRDGSLLLFRETDIAILAPSGAVRSILRSPEAKFERFNDCLALPSGGVMVGSYSHPRKDAALLHLAPDGVFSGIAEGTGIANGLALSPDHEWLYWTDSTNEQIVRFPFNPSNDAVGGAELVHRSAKGDGTPDGLTVDSNGWVYSARWGGHAVIVLDGETGAEVDRIPIPGAHVTSCVFAGPALDVLVVTVAEGPIVAVEGIAKGLAEFRSAVHL